ncbi:MAG: sn-glycerol-1-phosphate dehydrogenase [Chloroflexi bacterium]|nr:sn-glycerol-1-phosphate dehydrogenase [Chloroflexota bacterium]
MSSSRALVERALSVATDTRHLILAPGAIKSVVATFDAIADGRPAVVVADRTTWRVAGERVDGLLRAAGRQTREPILLPDGIHADIAHVESVQEALSRDTGLAVVVGSGTLNDLGKLASARLGRPYMVVATAASMDGYAAFGAAITRDGFKQTFACPAPAAIVADLDVIAAAPTPLTAAGYGDLLGKVTAGADWIVADALGVEPVDAVAWSLVQAPLRDALSAPGRLRQHDPTATEHFFLGLVLSGLAMQAARSSRPASGGEHLISHLWEMLGLSHNGTMPSHGVKVGIGTVLVSLLYGRLLARDLDALDVEARVAALPSATAVEQTVRAALPAGEIADRAVVESLAKLPSADELRRRLELAREAWPALRERLQAQLLPPAALRRRLADLDAAATPAEVGVGPEQLRADLRAARLIRRRYTMLDLAAELGLLDACIDEVVSAVYAPGLAEEAGAQPQPATIPVVGR